MGLLLHQFRKDLRQTWIVWVLWLLFTGLQFALAAWNVGASDMAGQGLYAQLLGLVPTVHNLLLFVLVPMLLLQEPTVGTTAFWLTKPMPRGVVLGSKLLALLVLVAVPLAGRCAVLASHGLTPGDVALAGLQIGLHELGWIALITALAALSPSFGWYLVAAVAFLALQYFAGWIINWGAMLASRRHPVPVSLGDPVYGLGESRAVVHDLVWIGASLGVAVFQYLTRRTRAALGIAAAGLALAYAAAWFWPWNFLGGTVKEAAAPPPGADRVTVQPGGYHNAYDQPDWRGGPPLKNLSSGLDLQGVDATREVSIESLGGELALPGGEKLALPGSPGWSSGGGAKTSAVDAALGDLPLLGQNPYGNGIPSATLFALDAAAFAKHAAVAGDATFRFRIHAWRYRIAEEIPLAKGASYGKGSDRTTLAEVLQDRDGVSVALRSRSVQLLLRPVPFRIGYYPVVYVLVNRKRGEAVIGQDARRFMGDVAAAQNPFLAGAAALLGGGDDRIESVNESAYFFGPPLNWPDRQILPVPLDAAWLADASLAVLEPEADGAFPATMKVANFSLDGKGLPDNRVGRSDVGVDKAALAAIALPENPTRPDVWRYLTRINEVSQRQRGMSPDDPQVGMYQALGPGHASEMLLAVGAMQNPWHLVQALVKMDLSGQPGAREMTIRLLRQQTDLIHVVTKNHWEKEAEPVLFDRIRNQKAGDYLNDEWIPALASLRDPATYDALIACAEARSADANRGGWYLDALRAIPGPRVAEMVGRLWGKARGTKEERQFLGIAASWGIADALDRAAGILAGPADAADKDKTALRNAARDTLRNATACPDRLLDADLAAWYQAGKAQLGFDPFLGRFILHPAVPPPDDGWPQPDAAIRNLGWWAAAGDPAALDALDAAMGRLLEGLDPKRDEGRYNGLRRSAGGAFGVLREAAGDDPSVLSVLEYANGKERFRNLVAWSYGKAAANGNEAALDALIHYKDHDWTAIDALNSVWDAVKKNNPRAVDFVLATYADPGLAALPDPKAARNKLVAMIQDAANAGSDKAKAVYETIQK